MPLYLKEECLQSLTIEKIHFRKIDVEMEDQSNEICQSSFDEINQLIQKYKEKENWPLFSEISIWECKEVFIKQILGLFSLSKEIKFDYCKFSVNIFTRLTVSYCIFIVTIKYHLKVLTFHKKLLCYWFDVSCKLIKSREGNFHWYEETKDKNQLISINIIWFAQIT